MPAAEPPEYVRHCLDRLAPLGPIECRRFFGGWQFRIGGEQFAAVLRKEFYLRAAGPLQAEIAAAGGRPFRYSRRDREVEVPGYITPPEECLDDDEAFCGWARRALEQALANPKPKRAGGAARKRGRKEAGSGG